MYNQKKNGENIIILFLTVADSVNLWKWITQQIRFSYNNCFTRCQFWPRRTIWCKKNQTKKSCTTVLLNLVRALKGNLKLVPYHSKILSNCSVLEVVSRKSFLGNPALESCPAMAVLYWQSCSDNHVVAVLFWNLWYACRHLVSRFACPIWAVQSQLSYFKCPVLAEKFWQCCAGSPVLSACPALVVMFWLSCSSRCPFLRSFHFCHTLAVFFKHPCAGSHVLAVLFCLSHSGGPVLAVLFKL